jgi:hypothetical protein
MYKLFLPLFFFLAFFKLEAKTHSELFDFKISTAHIEANAYPYILDTFYQDQMGHSILLFVDGASWIIRDCKPGEEIFDILNGWSAGDEIRLHPRISDKKEGKFILKNVQNGSVLFGDLNTPPMQEHLILCISCMDSNGYFISLTDGSSWTISWLNSWITHLWKPGDRIIINKSNCREDYLLINADTRDNKWVYAEGTIWRH